MNTLKSGLSIYRVNYSFEIVFFRFPYRTLFQFISIFTHLCYSHHLFLYSNQLFIFSSHPIPFHPIPCHFISSNKQFHTSSSFLPSFPSLLPLHRILRQHIDRPAIHIQHRVLHAHSELPQLLRHLLAPIELRFTSLLRSHINSRLHAERHARRQRRAAADRRRVDVVQPDVVPDVVREILEIQFLFHHRATKYPRFLELL